MKNNMVGAISRWYKKNARSLPWRETVDPYKIWISEMMLQQTTVPTVIAFYKKWIKDYPTVAHVAQAPVERILKSWQGLGYYQRARNIHRAAKIFSDDHGGRIPEDYATLRKIPGFGPYTTGAVMSIAFDKRYPIVDANIRRIVMRVLAMEDEATSRIDGVIYDYLEEILPEKDLRTFNQALMELGALVCKSKEPLCSMCPIKSHCKAFEAGIQEIIPQRIEKSKVEINVAVGILRRGGKYFIQQRPASGLLADLWEFPGGKIEKGEEPEAALKRELKEELNICIKKAKYLTKVRHFYTRFKVNLYAFTCEPESFPRNGSRQKWIGLKDFSNYPMPSGSAKIVAFLRAHFSSKLFLDN